MALLIIMVWYLGIGVFTGVGIVTVGRLWFTAQAERMYLALLLVPVAAVYLAFARYFEAPGAMGLVGGQVVVIGLLGVTGTRVPALAAAGWALHGAWDLWHEVVSHGAGGVPPGMTPIPLAYGIFCAAVDWVIAAYLLRRRAEAGEG